MATLSQRATEAIGRIVETPGVLVGQPRLDRTRVGTVSVEGQKAGVSLEDIFAAYPSLDLDFRELLSLRAAGNRLAPTAAPPGHVHVPQRSARTQIRWADLTRVNVRRDLPRQSRRLRAPAPAGCCRFETFPRGGELDTQALRFVDGDRAVRFRLAPRPTRALADDADSIR